MTCESCGKSMESTRFHMEGGDPLCEPCWEDLYGKDWIFNDDPDDDDLFDPDNFMSPISFDNFGRGW